MGQTPMLPKISKKNFRRYGSNHLRKCATAEKQPLITNMRSKIEQNGAKTMSLSTAKTIPLPMWSVNQDSTDKAYFDV